MSHDTVQTSSTTQSQKLRHCHRVRKDKKYWNRENDFWSTYTHLKGTKYKQTDLILIPKLPSYNVSTPPEK